jgi:N-acetylneuraminic acid mutarotase
MEGHKLHQEIAALREELSALEDCLEETCLLNVARFRERLRKQRSRSGRRTTSPAISQKKLPDSAISASHKTLAMHVPQGLDQVYMLGGTDGVHVLRDALQFSSTAKSWQQLPPMSESRCAAQVGVVGGKLCICGGHNGQKVLCSAETFDPSARQWTQLPPMMQARMLGSTAVVAGCLYVCGGHTSNENLDEPRVCTAERLDPVSLTWETIEPMSEVRCAAATVVLGGKLYVCGGFDGQARLRSAERFDPLTGKWQPLPPMVRARDEAAAVVIAGELYVLGGFDGSHVLNSVERFSPLSSSWEVLPPMSTMRAAFSACEVKGQLYACGGSDGQHCLATVERFDPIAGTWHAVAPMTQARKSAGIVEMGGRMLILGGSAQEKENAASKLALSSVECFDPDVGTWKVLPAMPGGRELAAAIAIT